MTTTSFTLQNWRSPPDGQYLKIENNKFTYTTDQKQQSDPIKVFQLVTRMLNSDEPITPEVQRLIKRDLDALIQTVRNKFVDRQGAIGKIYSKIYKFQLNRAAKAYSQAVNGLVVPQLLAQLGKVKERDAETHQTQITVQTADKENIRIRRANSKGAPLYSYQESGAYREDAQIVVLDKDISRKIHAALREKNIVLTPARQKK